MTYDDNREWIHESARAWQSSGASVVARDPKSGDIAGTLLATVLTKNRNTSFDGALKSPKLKVKHQKSIATYVTLLNLRTCIWMVWFWRGLEMLSANGGRFEINQLLFEYDRALVVDSDEKLCILVSEFGRACERRKVRVNVAMSSQMDDITTMQPAWL